MKGCICVKYQDIYVACSVQASCALFELIELFYAVRSAEDQQYFLEKMIKPLCPLIKVVNVYYSLDLVHSNIGTVGDFTASIPLSGWFGEGS
uniref:Uncharacterized protein n=1 Tax=Arundo donax TaxID=35708 RepID=A0A0A9E3E2_ARUDO